MAARSDSPPEEKGKEGGGTRGLLSCIGGVGGVSITIWLLFFVFLEPYDPNKSPCTQLGSVEELQGGLKLLDVSMLDRKQFGKNLGLTGNHLEDLPPLLEDDPMRGVDTVLKVWYASKSKACWEAVVQALVKMGQTENAERLADAYRLKVKRK